MNKTQTDKQFALIVEDFYDDEMVAEYPSSYTSRADVFSRKLALVVIVSMLAIIAIAYVVQNPMTIPAAVVVIATVVAYRKMVKSYVKKTNG